MPFSALIDGDSPRSRAEAIASGLRWYFTGKPCKYGHIAKRSVSRYYCFECHKVVRRKNPNRVIYQQRAHAKFKSSEHGKASLKAAMAKWESSPHGKAYRAARRKTEQGRVKMRHDRHVQRARKRAAVPYSFTRAEESKLRALQTLCHICEKKFTKADPATLDHVVALANGGLHIASNIALAHLSCNSRKNAARTHLV